jgi:hypothetical protein
MGFLLALTLSSGCQLVEKTQLKSPPAVAQEISESEVLDLAHEAFLREDYLEASRWFGHLVLEARSPLYKRAGLYGLACTKILLASDTDQLHQAMEIWLSWADRRPDKLSNEDPRLLTPLLKRFQRLWALERSVSELKRRLSQMEEEISKSEAEIQVLRRKLKALEEIDRAIQRKKLRLSQ